MGKEMSSEESHREIEILKLRVKALEEMVSILHRTLYKVLDNGVNLNEFHDSLGNINSKARTGTWKGSWSGNLDLSSSIPKKKNQNN